MVEFHGGGNHFLQPRPGVGYGYGGAIITDPALADLPMGAGSFMWDGAGGTWFWVDPTYDIVVVGMAQRLGWLLQGGVAGLPANPEQLCIAAVYQALLRPEL
jgi:CubicO group peptidase (beta-lactamase class C family)